MDDQTHFLTPPRRGQSSAGRQRFVAGAVLTVTTLMLYTGYALHPAKPGVGTHEQLGLPPCGMLTRTNIPCVTCGMTTAFSLATHGRLINAATTQPAGAALAVAVAAVALISGYALGRGASLGAPARWLWQPAVLWWVGGLVIGSWLYKIAVMTPL